MPSLDRRELAAIFAGGTAGALLRAGLAEAMGGGAPHWPWPTFIVNIAGTFALGYFVTRLQERPSLEPDGTVGLLGFLMLKQGVGLLGAVEERWGRKRRGAPPIKFNPAAGRSEVVLGIVGRGIEHPAVAVALDEDEESRTPGALEAMQRFGHPARPAGGFGQLLRVRGVLLG
jgi:CrcB-like protein, Camphor Resistance (CrcB)